MQNTKLLTSTALSIYLTLVHRRLGEDIDIVDVVDIWGKQCFFWNSFVKVELVEIIVEDEIILSCLFVILFLALLFYCC